MCYGNVPDDYHQHTGDPRHPDFVLEVSEEEKELALEAEISRYEADEEIINLV